MRAPQSEAAAPSAKGHGGEDETKGTGFEAKTYGDDVVGSIPSTEHGGRVALVVRRHDRLFAVDHRPEGEQ